MRIRPTRGKNRMSSDKERKKLLTDKQQAILDIVVTTIEALVVVVCIVVSVLVWVGASDPADRSFNWFAIQTDSMMGSNPDSMNPGDLMFAKKYSSIRDLHATQYDADGKVTQLGNVVVYYKDVYDSARQQWVENQIITHRIDYIDYERNQIYTKGDNAPERDEGSVAFESLIGVYIGKAKGLGKVTLWLGGFKKVETPTGKNLDPNLLGGYGYEKSGSTAPFLVIIIPLALLFIYNGYVVVKWSMDERAKKIRAAALAEAEAKAEEDKQSQEDVKRAALTEYMRANGMSDEQIAAYFAEQAAKSETVVPEGERHPEPVEESPNAEPSEQPVIPSRDEVPSSRDPIDSGTDEGSPESSTDDADPKD